MSQEDLKAAFTAITTKQEQYNRLWRYYDGDHPLIYSQKRLTTLFQNMNARFIENWMSVVINASLDKIRLKSFVIANDEGRTKLLNQLWEQTEMNLDNEDAHLAALVTGEAGVIIWPDEDEQPDAYYNDPRLLHVGYEFNNPHRKRFAAKWFLGEDDHPRLTLYYPDHLEYYRSSSKEPQAAAAFQPVEDMPQAPNPYGQIPVFHLRRERRRMKSELEDVLTLQDAINKLLADMMVAAEFGAFRQRWVISNIDELGQLKNAPNEIWNLPVGDGVGQDTQVGEFSATDLSNYLTAMDKKAAAIAVITRTPKHFFFMQSGDPSGEALIALEAPLNNKCEKYIDRFKATWRKAAAFLLATVGETVDPMLIQPIFADPKTVQPYTLALIRKTNVDAGMPLVTVLRKEGWTEGDLADMEKDKAGEQERQQQSLAAAVLKAQQDFQGGAGSNGLERPGSSGQ